MKRICIKNARAVLPDGIRNVDICAENGKIVKIGQDMFSECEIIDATDKNLPILKTRFFNLSSFIKSPIKNFLTTILNQVVRISLLKQSKILYQDTL